MDNYWHTKDIREIESILQTDIKKGLTEDEAEKRIQQYGYNELEEKKGRSPFRIFLSQFNDFMIWILIFAALISGFVVREITDAVVIFAILIINAVLGFIQEYRAEKAIQALKELTTPTALIIRNAIEKNINSKFIVPGDIIKFSIGNLIPVDCRIINEVNLQTNESILTGESLPVDKYSKKLDINNLGLGNRTNMLFGGTAIAKGRCTAIVIGTGKNSEIGRIANLVQKKEEQTPLQIELKTVGKRIGLICLTVSAIVLISGILKGNSISEMFMVAIALAVAAIPEGLPAIVTVSLALGVQRMSKSNAIVRRLSSVETLGRVSVICTDKTGTLTQNKMIAKKIYVGLKEIIEYGQILNQNDYHTTKLKINNNTTADTDNSISQYIYLNKDMPTISLTSNTKMLQDNPALKILLKNAVLCNDAYYLDKITSKISGDPTEGALIELGSFYSLDKKALEEELPRELEEPFDSIRKMMTTIHRIKPDSYHSNYLKDTPLISFSKNLNNSLPQYILFSKGAPETIISKCSKIIKDDHIEKITIDDVNEINKINSKLAGSAMRNLAFAFKYLDDLPDKDSLREIKDTEKDLIYSGMIGMIDPPRPEVYDAVKKCKKANINIIMVTGDHKLTAKAIGEELGILDDGDIIIDDEDFNHLSKEELQIQIEKIKVFARVSPEHKVDIIEALKRNDHIVAMTGDGVNDAPSLKQADIGLAMGITGTDVSKEASDIILTDDNFATIIKAIREGRVIYSNLKKFILFLLTCNISEVLLMFIAIVFGSFVFRLLGIQSNLLYIPILPVQILWMNLITDGAPALALGIDLAEKNVMERKVSKKREQILNKKTLLSVFYQGLILTIGSLFIYFIGPILFDSHDFIHDREVFQTCVFTTLVLTQLFHAYNFRFEEKGIFRKGIFANKFLNFSFLISILLQVAIVYVPFLQSIFKTAGLSLYQWLLVIISSSVPVIIINLINEIIYLKNRVLNRKIL
ncbi:MAG: cation-translocating P-type ATPase [Candidatus Humimicrobiaceae bacterium]